MSLQNESSLATATATAKAYLKSRLSTRSTDKAAAASSSDGMPDALGSPGHRHAKSEARAVASATRAGSGLQLGRASLGAARRGGDLGDATLTGTAGLRRQQWLVQVVCTLRILRRQQWQARLCFSPPELPGGHKTAQRQPAIQTEVLQ